MVTRGQGETLGTSSHWYPQIHISRTGCSNRTRSGVHNTSTGRSQTALSGLPQTRHNYLLWMENFPSHQWSLLDMDAIVLLTHYWYTFWPDCKVLSLLSPQPFGSRTRSFRGAKMLENAVRIAFPRANKNAVQFDDSKPELIHFGSHKAAPEQTAILPNNTVIKPKTCIRWLGVWLDRKLNFKVHVQTKIAAARRTLHSLFRLLNSEWGLKRYVY